MHSPIAPSSADCWVPCRGYVPMIARVPAPPETDESRDGTASHWVGSEALEGRPVAVGAVAPNGVVTTTEMHDGAQLWVDTVTHAATTLGLREHVQVESRLAVTSVHAECFGTTDTWLWDASTRTLRVWDYKYGHRFVEVMGNWQMILYALGVLELLGLDERNWSDVWIELTIVQPRCYRAAGPVRTWRFRAPDLVPYRNTLILAARGQMDGTGQLTAGEHCRDCPARYACPALNRAVHEVIGLSSEQYLDELHPGDLGFHLDALEAAQGLLKARISGIRGQMEARINSGKDVPGWTVERVPGHLKWTAPLDTVKLLAALYGKPLTKEEPVTPTQAIKAGIPADVVNENAKRGYSLTLARNDKLIARAAQELGHHGK